MKLFCLALFLSPFQLREQKWRVMSKSIYNRLRLAVSACKLGGPCTTAINKLHDLYVAAIIKSCFLYLYLHLSLYLQSPLQRHLCLHQQMQQQLNTLAHLVACCTSSFALLHRSRSPPSLFDFTHFQKSNGGKMNETLQKQRLCY